MNAQTLATVCFVGFDGEHLKLQVFTLDGVQHEYILSEGVGNTLHASLERAMKAEERAERDQALLIKSQPAGVQLGRFDV